MSGRKLYTKLASSEILNEIELYNQSDASRPPNIILKKILINLTTGNNQIIDNDKIWLFVSQIVLKFGDVNESTKKLSFLLLEIYLSNSFTIKPHGIFKGDAQLLAYIANEARAGNVNALHVLGCVDLNIVGMKMFKMYTEELWDIFMAADHNNMSVELVQVSTRLIQKIYKIEEDNEREDTRQDKIKVVFNKLLDLMKTSSEISIITSVCNSLIDLTDTVKYPFLKVDLKIEHISQLISTITQIRSNKAIKSYFNKMPSILTIIMNYKVKREDGGSVCKDIITCIKPFIRDESYSVVMNSIKCIIYYLGYTDDQFKSRILGELMKGFEHLFRSKDSHMITSERTLYFNCLRNLLLVIIKFDKQLQEDKGFLKDILEFVKIDINRDVENYIIDTKLEILYILSLKGIEEEMIMDILLPLTRCSVDEISYKTIRTIGNLVSKKRDRHYPQLTGLVRSVSNEKNVLALSIPIKELNDSEVSRCYVESILCRKRSIYPLVARDMYKDDDLTSYIWLLGETGHLDELIVLRPVIFSLVEDAHDRQIHIMDSYLTSILKAAIKSGTLYSEMLAVLKEVYANDKFTINTKQRVEFYSRLLCSGLEKAQILQVLTIPTSGPNSVDTSALPAETVDSLCKVFGSLACIYLRDVHSVFRNC